MNGLSEHLGELRRTLLLCLAALLAATFLAFCCHKQLLKGVAELLPRTNERTPLQASRLYNHSREGSVYRLGEESSLLALSLGAKRRSDREVKLEPGAFVDLLEPARPILLGPAEGLASALNLSFWAGACLSSPLWLCLMLRFVAPGLTGREKRLARPLLLLIPLFFLLGGLFAYFASIPAANALLFSFNEEIGTNLWSLGHYLNFVLGLFAANCIAFELAAVLFFLVHAGFCSHAFLAEKRGYVVVSIFTLAAILTPPDIATQALLAAPLWLLYELIVFYAGMRQSIGLIPLSNR